MFKVMELVHREEGNTEVKTAFQSVDLDFQILLTLDIRRSLRRDDCFQLTFEPYVT